MSATDSKTYLYFITHIHLVTIKIQKTLYSRFQLLLQKLSFYSEFIYAYTKKIYINYNKHDVELTSKQHHDREIISVFFSSIFFSGHDNEKKCSFEIFVRYRYRFSYTTFRIYFFSFLIFKYNKFVCDVS